MGRKSILSESDDDDEYMSIYTDSEKEENDSNSDDELEEDSSNNSEMSEDESEGDSSNNSEMSEDESEGDSSNNSEMSEDESEEDSSNNLELSGDELEAPNDEIDTQPVFESKSKKTKLSDLKKNKEYIEFRKVEKEKMDKIIHKFLKRIDFSYIDDLVEKIFDEDGNIKNKDETKIDISKYLKLTEKKAAKKLSFSLSTLSRRYTKAVNKNEFYSKNPKLHHWPYRYINNLEKNLAKNIAEYESLSTDSSASKSHKKRKKFLKKAICKQKEELSMFSKPFYIRL